MESRSARVTIARPRGAPRILRSDFEQDTALDFEVELNVDGKYFEGCVTLHDPYLRGPQMRSGRWGPCRSLSWPSAQYGPDWGWLHGQLNQGIDHARTIAGARANDMERALILALSGADWDPIWWFEATRSSPKIVRLITLEPPLDTEGKEALAAPARQ